MFHSLRLPARRLMLALTLTTATAAGVGLHLNTARAQTETGAPPPPAVQVAEIQLREIRTWANFSGRLAPVASANIKPLVGGRIETVHFVDGDLVQKGEPLFLIDPRPHQAALARAVAQLEAARSRAALAEDEMARARRLLQDQLISQSLFDAAQNEYQTTRAAVAEAEAARQQAELNVDYAHIEAPVTGRISRAELTEGNVVEAGPNAPVLANIVASDRLYAEFNVDEQTFIRFARGNTDPADMPVELTLDADDTVVYQGQLHAFDNRLDTASGTIRARALVENTDGALTAGMYARVRLGSAQLSRALIVPERAIGTNQDKKFVLVVDESNTARYRPVTLGKQWRGQRIIEDGLAPGDRVIVGGLAHARPDALVSPQPIDQTEAVAATF